MNELDRQIAVAVNRLIGSSSLLFETMLFLTGSLPLVACVAVMLALWWTDLEGGVTTGGPVLGGGVIPGRPGLHISRRRCVAMAACTAGAFVCTRLIAFGTDLPRPLAREVLTIPIDAARWQGTVKAMTGFGAFPSDHAALFFAIGVGLFAWRRSWGWAGMAAATFLAAGRVGIGFHYPSDMAAGAAIGAMFGLVAIWLARVSGAPLDGVVALFDRHPALMYPLLFIGALDFTHHFRLILRGVFYFLLTLLGG